MTVKSIGGQQNIDLFRLFNEKENLNTQNKTDNSVNSEQVLGQPTIVPDFRAEFRKFQLMQKLAQVQAPSNQLGNLKATDQISVKIEEKDTQSDVLKKAYIEFGKRAGLDDPEYYAAQMAKDGDLIYHPNTNNVFSTDEFQVEKNQGSINISVTDSDMTTLRKAKIEELTSYSLFDWSVTSAEQKQAVDILKKDPNLSETIKGLESSGSLRNFIERVSNNENRRELVDLLGKNLNSETAEIVRSHIEKLDVNETFVSAPGGTVPATDVSQNIWQVRFNLARLGITPTTAKFDYSKYADLIGSNDSSPFSGVGASGNNPTNGNVPLGDQFQLLMGDEGTTKKYTNPLGSLTAYINSITPENRARQAELLINQPVSTTMTELYGDNPPSRADIIKAAATKYNLQPELVAAFILAEQRDQSKNEDAKDYTAATSLKEANTSIGLGQVVISTAQRNNLFSDLISDKTQKGLKHNDVARLLADDTVNIFAAAKYLRQTADEGSKKSILVLPNTQKTFPNIKMENYSNNSSQWSDDNIRALGSEYTSKAWDDKLSAGWGNFVLEAYRDVQRSGVFKR